MVDLFNATGQIGLIVQAGAASTFGDLFITLFVILVVLFALFMMLGVPVEYTGIVVLPYVLACAAFYSQFVGVLVVMIIVYAALFIFGRGGR